MRRVGLVLLASAAMAQSPEYQPIGNMSQLMVNIIYPASDAIFYVDRKAPSTDAEWNQLANQALILAESGNLLLMPGRVKEKGNWTKANKMMIDAGGAAFKAAKAKDIEGVRAVTEALNDSCIACHLEYRDGYGRQKKK